MRYQDEVHGSLIEQIDKTIDLVYTKYMKALIEYKGVQRIERFMFNPEYTIDDSRIMVCCNAGENYIRLLNDSVTNNVGKDVGKELSNVDMQLLKELENNPYITAAELGKLLNITTRTVERHIKTLKESGIIRRAGEKNPANGYSQFQINKVI